MVLIGCKRQSPALNSTRGLRRDGTNLTEESLEWLVICDESKMVDKSEAYSHASFPPSQSGSTSIHGAGGKLNILDWARTWHNRRITPDRISDCSIMQGGLYSHLN